MRHLKYFKESLSTDEIKEICDTCFAYLYDEGFYTEIREGNKIWIVKNNDGDYFYWSEIRDSLLSLMSLLDINEMKFYYYQPSYIQHDTKQKFIVFKENPSWDSQPLSKLEEIKDREGAYGRRSRISEITITLN